MIPAIKDSVLNHSIKTVYRVSTSRSAISVAIIAKDVTTHPTSSAFIRLISPLTYGATGKRINLSFYTSSEIISNFNVDVDVYIVQRTAFDSLEAAKKFVAKAKKSNKKIIIDTDDAFSRLDKNHPQYNIQKNLVEALHYVIEQADKVWVSTDELKDGIDAKAVVYKNTVDNRVWLPPRPTHSPVSNILRAVYMGTGTHDDDLNMIVPAIDKLNEKYDNRLELTIIGVATSLPEKVWLKRLVIDKGSSLYPKFVGWFMRQGPYDIGLAPLIASDFNKAKSDIKVLDYLNLGVIPVVSDLDPYKGVELDDYVVRVGYGSNDWFSALEDIVLNKSDYIKYRNTNLKSIKKYITKDRTTKTISKKMLTDIKGLVRSS